MRAPVAITTSRRCTLKLRRGINELKFSSMEEQILPETDVAELELEAVIGFNGEASSIRDISGAVRR